jgi:hypothetical protein
MRFAMIGLFLSTALLTSGCRNDARRSIRMAGNDEHVALGHYPVDDLGWDSSKWTWVKKTGRPIEEVVVFPTISPDPYSMGENKDVFGTIEGNTVRIQFKTGGVYVVKIVYQDRSAPPEIRMVLVAVTNDKLGRK